MNLTCFASKQYRLPLSGRTKYESVALPPPLIISDLEIRAGNWPILWPNPFPYIPGIEAVGEVVEIGADVSEFRIGDRVMTTMQGLGGVRAQRPGAYAAYVVVQATPLLLLLKMSIRLTWQH